MSWNDEDFNSSDPLVRYNAHQAAKGRPLMPDPDEIRKREKENGGSKIYLTSEEFLASLGTDMNEMAEIQEKIEGGEIDDPSESHIKREDASE